MSISPKTQITSSKNHKFLVIGDASCGKTSNIDYFCNQEGTRPKVPKTIGCDIHIKEIFSEKSGMHEYLEFLDLSGEINHQEITQVYLQALEKDIDCLRGIIFFFDTRNIKTLQRVTKYLEDIVARLVSQKNQKTDQDGEAIGIPLLMVGTKQDQLDEKEKEKRNLDINKNIGELLDSGDKMTHTFLSTKSLPPQFQDFEMFIQACINEDLSRLYIYNPYQKRRTSYESLTDYTFRKISSVRSGLKTVKVCVSLRMLHVYTLITALSFTYYKKTDGVRQS
jgi:GTPase SAR1 family protein